MGVRAAPDASLRATAAARVCVAVVASIRAGSVRLVLGRVGRVERYGDGARREAVRVVAIDRAANLIDVLVGSRSVQTGRPVAKVVERRMNGLVARSAARTVL